MAKTRVFTCCICRNTVIRYCHVPRNLRAKEAKQQRREIIAKNIFIYKRRGIRRCFSCIAQVEAIAYPTASPAIPELSDNIDINELPRLLGRNISAELEELPTPTYDTPLTYQYPIRQQYGPFADEFEILLDMEGIDVVVTVQQPPSDEPSFIVRPVVFSSSYNLSVDLMGHVSFSYSNT
ncbi:hypothetical protein BDQ17DRAFT_1330184 [Cyathus striatus]|nr:hypothetical protein BDQ17DRAFT_1330184 [Cyathus striatus]